MRYNNIHRKVAATAISPAVALAVATPPVAWGGPAPANALQVIMLLQREGGSEYWWTSSRIADPKPVKRASGVGAKLLYRTVYIDVQC